MPGWEALIPIGGQILGGLFGAKGSSDAAGISEEQLRLQQQWNQFIQKMVEDAYAKEQEYMAYMFQQDEWLKDQAKEFMDYSRGWQQDELDRRLRDWGYADYRLNRADQEAAAERVRQLEWALDNKAIAKEEREAALKELQYQKQIAAGERAYDVKRFEEDRATQRKEREYQIQQYERMMRQLREERAYEMGRTEQVRAGAERLGSELERVWQSFGNMQPRKQYDETDVDSAENLFLNDYMSDAERAATKIASINEASDINLGRDISTTGELTRKDILQNQIAPLYAQARTRARQDALGYITGLNTMGISNEEQELQRRNQLINEVVSALGPEINILNSMQMPGSATSDLFTRLQSGILDRNLQSALNYDSSLLNKTAITEPGQISYGMADMIANPVARYGTNFAPFNMTDVTWFNPLANMSKASSFLGGYQGGDALGWAKMGSQGMGDSMREIFSGLGNLWSFGKDNNWWGSGSGSGSGGGLWGDPRY